jgi:uncharacterized protein (DUF2252 family)
MNQAAMIVAVISVIASLVLVARSSALRRADAASLLRLGLIWGVIILALVLVISFTGLRVTP